MKSLHADLQLSPSEQPAHSSDGLQTMHRGNQGGQAYAARSIGRFKLEILAVGMLRVTIC